MSKHYYQYNLSVVLCLLIFATLSCDSPGVQRVKEKRKLRIEKERLQKVDCYNYFNKNPYVINFYLAKCVKHLNGGGKSVFRIKGIDITIDNHILPFDSVSPILNRLNYHFQIAESNEVYFKTYTILSELYNNGLVTAVNKVDADVNNLKYRLDLKNKKEYCQDKLLNSKQDCRKWTWSELLHVK